MKLKRRPRAHVGRHLAEVVAQIAKDENVSKQAVYNKIGKQLKMSARKKKRRRTKDPFGQLHFKL